MLPSALDVPVLLAASPLLVPPAGDWPSCVRLTGHWATSSQPESTTPSDLLAFLDQDPPAVFVGFGSVGHPSDSQLFIDAARQARVRIIVSRPRNSEVETGRVNDDIYVIGEISHAWLFPQTAGVIHHGSEGMTSTALRASIPSAAVPHQFDQNYYARRLSLLGVGPGAIPRRQINSEALAGMMKAMTTEPAAAYYRRRAQHFGSRAVRESGTKQAIRIMRAAGML
jgi:sterol 3beta-glucosyltransferase